MTLKTFDLRILSDIELYQLKARLNNPFSCYPHELYKNEIITEPKEWFTKKNNFYYLTDDLTIYDLTDMILFTQYIDPRTKRSYNFISLYNVWMVYLVVNDLVRYIHLENFEHVFVEK